jgi:macrodomain Ter protein organizer (MatP/YcbG family)
MATTTAPHPRPLLELPPRPEPRYHRASVRMPQDQWEQLACAARSRGRTPSEVIRYLIDRALSESAA